SLPLRARRMSRGWGNTSLSSRVAAAVRGVSEAEGGAHRGRPGIAGVTEAAKTEESLLRLQERVVRERDVGDGAFARGWAGDDRVDTVVRVRALVVGDEQRGATRPVGAGG